jgi:hypothetical protein
MPHTALETPEILLAIFEASDSAAQAASAVTCGLWCELALGVLWRHLNSPVPLMLLYAPMQRGLSEESPDIMVGLVLKVMIVP